MSAAKRRLDLFSSISSGEIKRKKERCSFGWRAKRAFRPSGKIAQKLAKNRLRISGPSGQIETSWNAAHAATQSLKSIRPNWSSFRAQLQSSASELSFRAQLQSSASELSFRAQLQSSAQEAGDEFLARRD